MSNELREKLEEDLLEEAPWDGIRPHVARVVIVHGLELVDVGEALARDETERVEEWLELGSLARPTAEDLKRWERDQPTFWMLIVQPWILVIENRQQKD